MIRSIWSNHHKRRPIIYGIDDLETTRTPKCMILTHKFARNSFTRHLLTPEDIEACVWRVLVCDNTQKPNSFKRASIAQNLAESSTGIYSVWKEWSLLLMRKPTVRRCHISLVFTWWCKSLLQEWIGRRLWIHRRQWPGHCSQARGTGRDGGWTQTIETSANPEWNTFIEQMCINHLLPSCYIVQKQVLV